MIRFLMNTIGAIFLALALVFAVADIARSLAEDVVRFTPFEQALASVGLSLDAEPGQTQSAIDFLALVSAWPASALLAVAAFLFLFLGRSRRRPQGRLAR